MPTLNELMQKFASAADGASNDTSAVKAASAQTDSGGTHMNTLQDLYLKIANKDHEKVAAAAAAQPTDEDFAAMAEKLAAAEAAELTAGEQVDEQQEQVSEDDEERFVKQAAQEYDAAGRIMARGFFDEFMKLASETSASPNQTTESESAAKTPALGERGLPTMETNFAGSPNHTETIKTEGSRTVNANTLDTAKKINAGVTGENPEAAANSLGSGSPAGFATVRDLMA